MMRFLTQFQNSLVLLLIILRKRKRKKKKLPLPPAALWYDSFICDTYLLRLFCHVGRFFAPETLHYIPLDDCAIYWNNSMSSTIMRRKPKGENKKVNLIDADLNMCSFFTLTGHNMRGKKK